METEARKCTRCHKEVTPEDAIAWAKSGLTASQLCCVDCLPSVLNEKRFMAVWSESPIE